MDDSEVDSQAETFAEILRQTANEPILCRRAGRFLNPPPEDLATGPNDAKALQDQVQRLIDRLGGLPRLLIHPHGGTPDTFDTYVNAIFSEAVALFHRARRAVMRAHIAFIGRGCLEKYPHWIKEPTMRSVEREALVSAASTMYWEHAETAYIRLASYWDRIGQILDFVFFRNRHFERDGVAAVLERIHLNLIPLDRRLATLDAWRAIRTFQTSEGEDGLKWLTRRRNLLVHSLHLQPLDAEPEDKLFNTLHNHLDVRLREKLKPGTPEEELQRLHTQLRQAASLFREVLILCEARLS